MNKQRIVWIDYAKAIGIMLVICLHIPANGTFKGIINSFVLPMFFILSGMTFSLKDESLFSFVKKKFRTLVWPSFILCGVLNTLIELIYSFIIGITYQINIKKIVLGTILQLRGGYDFGAWFLICLFTAEIMMYILTKYFIKNEKHILCWMVLFYVGGHLYSKYIDKTLPWSLDVALITVSFILLGYLIKEMNLFEIITKWYLVFVYVGGFIAGNYLAVAFHGGINLYLRYFGNPFIALMTIIGGTGAVITVCKGIKENRVLQFIGKNSLIIYCMQYSMIYILDPVIHISNSLINVFIYFILTLISTMGIAYILKKYIPVLVGIKYYK